MVWKHNLPPMYAFGYGLSYTSFSYADLKLSTVGPNIKANFTVKNTGNRSGADVPQLDLYGVNGVTNVRLLAFERVELAAGVSKEITLTVEPRLLANFNWNKQRWEIKSDVYNIALGKSANDLQLHGSTSLKGREFR